MALICLAGKKNLHPILVAHRQDAAWCNIARRQRFDYKTVRPIDGRDYHYFTAVPLPDDERDGGVIVLPHTQHITSR